MSQEYDPMEPMTVRQVKGRKIDIEWRKLLPDDLMASLSYGLDRDKIRQAEIVHAVMKVVAFGETTTSVRFDFPECWKDMLRQRLRGKYPWLKRFIREPRMSPHWKEAKTFEKVCPHVGQGMMPSREDCIEFVVKDKMPQFRGAEGAAPRTG